MANYKEWNQALAKYFLSGVPLGTKIYLSVDRDSLEFIGQTSFSSQNATNWSEDFQAAVIKQIVFDNEVNLNNLQDIADGGTTRLNKTLYKFHRFKTLEVKW